MRKRFNSHKCTDVRPWVIAAITDESRYPSDQLWKKEPSAKDIYDERLRRIKFLRKHSATNPQAQTVVDRLESCEPKYRCLSGACPECGRLLQRWFVRRSKKFIATHIDRAGHDLVAISLVPSDLFIRPGYLTALNIRNFIRRAKLKLKKAGVD